MITIGDLRRAGQGLYAHCVDCGRERTLDPRRIALPDDLPVNEVGGKLKCRDCGSRRIFTMPAAQETAKASA